MQRFFLILFLLVSGLAFSQTPKQDSLKEKAEVLDSIEVAPKSDIQAFEEIKKANAPADSIKFSPIKAGLYSAVLPGLGQFYNKKYWKIPVVWGAVGTGVGIAIWNQNNYQRYRDAYVAELNGQEHEFSDISGVTAEVLGRTQDRMKRQRDYAIAITGLVYILNIVDAVVDAHLYEGKHDPDLAISPTIIYDEYGKQNTNAGIALRFNF